MSTDNDSDSTTGRFQIARALRETGLLLSMEGDNPYRARAYVKGASAIEGLAEDLGKMVAENRLTDLPGIGPSLAAVIAELHKTGQSKTLQQLRQKYPPGAAELSQVPGLTLKRIQSIYSELGISTIDELEAACNQGAVKNVKGFGPKIERLILEGLIAHKNTQSQINLAHARDLANQIVQYLKATGLAERVEIAGTIRRWHDVISEITVVVQSNQTDRIMEALRTFPMTKQLEQTGEGNLSATLATGIKAHLTVRNTGSYIPALLEATGSAQHIAQLREIAQGQGMSLTGEALTKQGKVLPCKTEQEIYENLGLSFIPPELREGLGEIEEAMNGSFDDLIKISDIRGMIHCHSTFSDGANTIEEMAQAAQKLGMEYMTISDHSPTAHYAQGLTVERLRQQWAEIAKTQKNCQIKLLKSTESDILKDGSLDYPDEILAELDVIIASIHQRMKLDEHEMTVRVINAMKHPRFKIWGHPLGRLVLRRDPIKCDVERILDIMAGCKAAIEISGDPFRLDMEPHWARLARKRKIPFVISTDAHSTYDLENLEYGVHQARRAGVRKSEVLNSLPLEEFRTATA